MSRLPLLFLVTAATCMVAGVMLGIGMGMAHDFRLMPVHAHTNLVGWASLALMGLTLRAWPALAEGRTAMLQFALSAGSALAFPVGIYFAVIHEAPGLAIAAGMVWLLGALLFLGRLLRLLLVPVPRRAAAMLPAE
ncbi:cytochrome-c oxidase [Roseomonas sp. AR75]|uniref:cytochrome-c oxidase n=1 Tax=Roseomonas sp. AR75 TaxID=2562311 RepID=UPI0010C15629|nr:cytochrome-c oxidase [Roseomonas sp. AR75]